MKFFVFALLLINLQAFAQPKPLFKIISCSEGVMVDGSQIKSGDVIYSNSNKFVIPKTGYVGILTIEGYAHLLTKETEVATLNNQIKTRMEKEKRGFGAIHRSMPNPFKIAGGATNQYSEIYGDSVLIAFKSYYEDEPPFKITVFDMFDHLMFEVQIDQSWKFFSTDSLLKNETAIIFQISSNRVNRNALLFLIKKLSPSKKKVLDFDFDRLSTHPVALLAFFEINKLFYDQIFQLYKIKTSKQELNLDEFSSAYLARTRERYHLVEYMTK